MKVKFIFLILFFAFILTLILFIFEIKEYNNSYSLFNLKDLNNMTTLTPSTNLGFFSSDDKDNYYNPLFNVLNEFWLQLYNSSNRKDPTTFRNNNFYEKSGIFVFNMCGNKKRVELRHKKKWKIKNIFAKMNCTVRLFPKDADTFTFMQIMSYDLKEDKNKYYHPLLRIYWSKNYRKKHNHIWATMRLSLYKDHFKEFDLGSYHDGDITNLVIVIENNTLKIYRDHNLKVCERINRWSHINYFKLGNYIQRGGCSSLWFYFVNISVHNFTAVTLPPENHNKIYENITKRYPIKWYYKLSTPLSEKEVNEDYMLYDIDLFDNSKDIISALKKEGKLVFCYFSFGAYEDWRKDVKGINKSLLGNSLPDWKGERWWNIRENHIKTIIKRRIDLAVEKGCDGIEMDNIGLYEANNGLNISRRDVLSVFMEMAQYAKHKGLLVALKNAPDLVDVLRGYYDIHIVEECFEYNECSKYLSSGKPVLDVEYTSDKKEFCNYAKKNNISAVKACYDLNGCWNPCWK